jgi:signal transduction histidine kinase
MVELCRVAMNKKNYYILAIVTLTVLITYLHFVTMRQFSTTKNEGTGLGMPIARKIIEGHAGALTVNSKQGVGTEATIRLPYKNMQ